MESATGRSHTLPAQPRLPEATPNGRHETRKSTTLVRRRTMVVVVALVTLCALQVFLSTSNLSSDVTTDSTSHRGGVLRRADKDTAAIAALEEQLGAARAESLRLAQELDATQQLLRVNTEPARAAHSSNAEPEGERNAADLIKAERRAAELERRISALEGELNQARQALAASSASGQLEDADPLDDNVYIDGFARQQSAMTIEELLVCDREINIIMDQHWSCDNDPTCIKCSQPQIKRYAQVRGIWESEKHAQPRLASIRKRFGTAKEVGARTVVVSAVNYGQMYLLLNWICSCERLGLDPREFALIVPTDARASKVLHDLGLLYVDPAWTQELSPPIREDYVGNANTGGHSDINNVLLLATSEVLNLLGHHVLLHDVDQVWLSDVRGWLVEASRRRDILGMFAPYYKAKGGMNTGFVFARNTRKSRVFFSTLVNLAALKARSDQELFNILLRHRDFQQLEFRYLPQKLFYKYSGRRAPKPTSATLVYHAVGSHKRFSFLHHKLWMFNATCSFYHAEVDKESLASVGG